MIFKEWPGGSPIKVFSIRGEERHSMHQLKWKQIWHSPIFASHSPKMHSLKREGCLKHAFAGALMETRLINGCAYWTWENCTIGRDRSMDKVVAHQELQQQWSDKSWLIIKNLNSNLRQLVWSWFLIKNCNNYLRQFDCSSRVAETIVRDSLVVWFSSRIATIIIDIIKNFNSNLR